jgi:hypothetical protein
MLLLLGAAMLVGGCNQGLTGTDVEAGRYRVEQAGARTILLDTSAGRAWELQEQNGVAKGWAPIQSLK